MNSRSIIRFPLAAAGLAAVVLAAGCSRTPAPRDVPVLMYHNVLPDDPGLTVWQVGADEFARQMEQLDAAGYETVLPGDIVRAAAGEGTLPEKPVVITFDDGYEGVVKWAEPVLAAHGFKAICYLIAGRLAEGGEERGTFDSGPLLTAGEASAMVARGVVAVGSHSMTHSKNGPKLASEARVSRAELARRVGVDTPDYCYPYGMCGRDYMTDAMRRAEYRTALACGDGMFRFGTDTNLLEIPRVSVFGGHHGIEFRGADPERGEVAFSNDGATIPLRAVVRDGATGREWRGELKDVGGGGPVAFAFPREALDGAREVEAWDKFGIFRYWP